MQKKACEGSPYICDLERGHVKIAGRDELKLQAKASAAELVSPECGRPHTLFCMT